MTITNLARYKNGNVDVTLYYDGTKVREYAGTPLPLWPESIDLKITDYCDAGCGYCHENSTVKGRHAEVSDILSIVKDLPKGVEIAIGGGDPLAHPQIDEIMWKFKELGIIANVTINSAHIKRHVEKVQAYRYFKLLYGLGISYGKYGGIDLDTKPYEEGDGCLDIIDSNTIIHFIAGKDNPQDIVRFLNKRIKVLILGYKQYGRGIKYFNKDVYMNLKKWNYFLSAILGRGQVCFDNLAIEQLNLKARLTKEQWDTYYMGDDGKFTMYADAVKNEFAISSVSPRAPRENRTAIEYFQQVNKDGC